MIHIGELLTKSECEAIVEALRDEAIWKDGSMTAGGRARAVKTNFQADLKAPVVKASLKKIEKALRANEVFLAAAQPATFARFLISRYGEGMSYGDHVDAAYIGGVRTDISFTLFLNSAQEYDGGELVVETAGSENTVKGDVGSLILYPSNAVHRVEKVTRGERIACVGWVKSKIKSPEQRDILFEMDRSLADLNGTNTPDELATRLSNIRNNLLRIFGD